MIAEGKLRPVPNIKPVKAGCIPNSTFGIRNPTMNLSMKAALMASILLRLFSYLSGIMTNTSTTPKTKPQIAPRTTLFIVPLYQFPPVVSIRSFRDTT